MQQQEREQIQRNEHNQKVRDWLSGLSDDELQYAISVAALTWSLGISEAEKRGIAICAV